MIAIIATTTSALGKSFTESGWSARGSCEIVRACTNILEIVASFQTILVRERSLSVDVVVCGLLIPPTKAVQCMPRRVDDEIFAAIQPVDIMDSCFASVC